MRYRFSWDPDKARTNRTKHGVRFEMAATVFGDRQAMSLYDNNHSDQEDRWILLGIAENGSILVVHHTYNPVDEELVDIRIFSARPATQHESAQYLGQQP